MQGLNPGLPHCRQMLYRLSHWGTKFPIRIGSVLVNPPRFSSEILFKGRMTLEDPWVDLNI